MTIAIVTGASSGLGREYAKLLDEENVGEIWLISRHERTLQKTAEQLKTKSRILPLDLTQPSSYSRFADVLREHHPVVSYFIHAAGFGRMGSTTAMSERDTAGMIAIHCHAAVFLTTAVLRIAREAAISWKSVPALPFSRCPIWRYMLPARHFSCVTAAHWQKN